MRKEYICLTAGACFIALPALAAEARIPISGPATITTPGHYFVTQSFAAPTGGRAILIRSDDVIVDLNGQTLTQGSLAREVIGVDIDYALQGVVIRNGFLSGGQAGVGTFSSLGGGTDLARLAVERVEISDSRYGIVANALDVEIVSCHIHDVGIGGISAGGSATGTTARIVDNVLRGPGGIGISLVGARGGEIRGNQVVGFSSSSASAGSGAITVAGWAMANPGGGTRVEGNLVIVAPGATGDGIAMVTTGFGGEVAPGNLVLRNTVRGAGRFGIYSYLNNTRVEGNIVTTSGSHGINIGNVGAFGPPLAGFSNSVVGNQMQSNGGCGLNLANANTHMYRDNLSVGNLGPAAYCDPGFPNIVGPFNL